MNDNFYRAFEEKHRGTRQLIISRLRAYLPFVEPLSNIFRGAPTIDLGCGRGEWLELMAEIGFDPYGVDLDEGMLQACGEAGLPAEKGDAVAYIGHLPEESQAIVSAFHVVEHLSIEQVHIVILEALRVLKPGGLLIMETPNPENIIVSTQNFYLDPTHQRPIPSQLLSFLPEYHGFSRVKTIRLQESKELGAKSSLTLRDVLGGVSPDYAVIAQKGALGDAFHLLDYSFDLEYGLSLNTLATHYDNQIKNQAQLSETTANQAITMAQRAEVKAQQAEAKAQQAEAKAQQAEVKAQQAEAKAQQAEAKAQQAEVKAQQAEAKAQQAEQALILIFKSRSWRITAPLRLAGGVIRHPFVSLRNLANFTLCYVIDKFQCTLADVMRRILRRPRLTACLNRWLKCFPPLHQQLLAIASVAGILPGMPSPVTYPIHSALVPRGDAEKFYLRSCHGDKEARITVDEALEAIREDVNRFRGGE
jgi:SAM-dependent methyltransferase